MLYKYLFKIALAYPVAISILIQILPCYANNQFYWTGRLGNNIVQIINALISAQRGEDKIYIPLHASPLLAKVSDRYFSFGNKELLSKNIPSACYHPVAASELKEIMNMIVPSLCFAAQGVETIKNNPNAIVIHIRNGDIWLLGNLMLKGGHAQPPLEYYKTIFDRHPNNKTVLIVMSKTGKRSPLLIPLIKLIKHYNKKWTILTNTIEDDFTVLAHAEILVHSTSSFSAVAGIVNATKNSDKKHLQYYPYWPTNLRGFDSTTLFNEYDDRIIPLTIEGDFVTALQTKNNGHRFFSSEIMHLYNKNSTGELPSIIS